MKYLCGIDEAGRGPVIGPMVMCIVAAEKRMAFEFKTLGVKDSKMLTSIRRRELAEVIRREGVVETKIVSPAQIDEAVAHPSRNLNILEAEVAGELINRIVKRLGEKEIVQIVLDCPSINRESYLQLMRTYVENDKVKLIAEHKADVNYPTVAAASIIAKTMRDEEIEKLKKKHGVDFGSGYPGDALTARFVREHYDNKNYDFFRKTWGTYKRASGAGAQQTLGGFGGDLPVAVEKKKEKILSLGLDAVETKGVAEVVRVKGEGTTITLYSNGRVLVQGKNKNKWKKKVS